MTPDPPIRKDGICALDGCDKPVVLTWQSSVPVELRRPDSFCSTACCKQWHGVRTTVTSTGAGVGRGQGTKAA